MMYAQTAYPGSVGPGHAPPGWEYQLGNGVGTQVVLMFMDCTEVSLDGFAKGDVKLMFQAHSKANIPDSCFGGHGIYLILENVVVEDDDLAVALNRSLHVQVVRASFQDVWTEGPDYETGTWSLTNQAGQTSKITTSALGEPDTEQDTNWFLWHDSSGYFRLQFAYNSTRLNILGNPAFGDAADPLLDATISPYYLGVGGTYQHFAVTTNLTRFDSPDCSATPSA